MRNITGINQAIELFIQTVSRYSERNWGLAIESAMEGRTREHPAITIYYNDPLADAIGDTGAIELPCVEMPDSSEGKLARELISMLRPIEMLNPFKAAFELSQQSATLVTCFGIPLNPETNYAPSFQKSIDEVLSTSMPDPRTTGSMLGIKEKVSQIKQLTPQEIKIARGNTQSPFNIAHMLVGEEILTAPYLDAEKYHEFMSLLTDFWINCIKILNEWIGPERKCVWDKYVRITECSCNLISRAMYEQFVLPYDLRIIEELGPLSIHPCSGPHVFHETLELLPEIVGTEAGYIHSEATVAESISVDEALIAIGDRPILLKIGQELPEGEEYDFIKHDLDRYKTNKRLWFEYTGMHWKYKDRPYIRELHMKLDEYWAKNICMGSSKS